MDESGPLSSVLSPDQANFLVSQLCCLLLSAGLRFVLTPQRVGPLTRHAYCILFGVAHSVFLYGCWGTLNVLLVVSGFRLYLGWAVKYAGMDDLKGRLGRNGLVLAMGALSCTHIHRLVTDYQNYSLDVSGPLMIIVQKLSILSFALQDGSGSATVTKEEHRCQRLERLPTLVEYFSYIVGYLAFSTGPSFFFMEYRAFIEGVSIGPMSVSWKKRLGKNLVLAVICSVLAVKQPDWLPVHTLVDGQFHAAHSLPVKVAYSCACAALLRCKYYVAWSLGELMCNLAGYGFKGYIVDGEGEDWSLVCNIDIIRCETATSFKVFFDNWNMQTVRWLRYVLYTRIDNREKATSWVFLVSAVWHGFYPGYYITFLHWVLLVRAGRKIRRHIRPHFQGSRALTLLYQVATLAGTQVGAAYCGMPFVLLDLRRSILFYRNMHFCLLVASLSLLLHPLMP